MNKAIMSAHRPIHSDDSQPIFSRENNHHIRAVRSGSPYPDAGRRSQQSTAHLESSNLLRETSGRNSYQMTRTQDSSSLRTDSNSSEEGKRTTSIRWAENLTFPDRTIVHSSALHEHTSCPEARRDSFQSQNHDFSYDTYSSPDMDYVAEKRVYEAKKRYAKTLRNKEVEIEKPAILTANPSNVDDYVPPHKRGFIKSPSREVSATDYEAEADTESSSDLRNPHIPIAEVIRKSIPITSMALLDLPQRQGVAKNFKRSHSSWDVSSDGNPTSGCNAKSGHFSRTPKKMVEPLFQGPISPWIAGWLETVQHGCKPSFLEDRTPDHHLFAVDTSTGELMDRIEQPPTFANHEDEMAMKPAMAYRRSDWTSNLVIHREITIRQKIMQQQEDAKGAARLQQVTVTKSFSPTGFSDVEKVNEKSNEAGKKLLADCTLRPGLMSDASGCASIYNMAIAKNMRLVDTNSVSAQRFESIMNECKRENLPFIVAARQKADLTDAKNWPSLDAYQQYMKWKKTQPTEELCSEAAIYGLAYLSPYERGVGGGTGVASQTAKATVFVHPEHRRCGVGSALLHRLLTQTSILFVGHVEYKWSDPTATVDYFYKPEFRDIHRIIFQSMMKDEGDDNLKWMDDFMSTFQFDKAGHLSQVYQIEEPHGVEWYDQVTYIHWATKVDSRRANCCVDESECSYEYPGRPQPPAFHRAGRVCVDGSDGEVFR
ncbi:hypothetical protein CCHL11_02997 [Colletotrichum chlorophyti]|uniref:N-acetyltransferase domain-containing protein n=1 Tax=Colletotrichum chlorophyti TaxID=708187 RepID=A0A1Q8RGI1_9PEZI|nr:hypothetical protein CCHL11_02997 [Colletotrichum chlorophyti]